MINYISIAQIIVSLSVFYVWIFRYNNIVEEFLKFGLSGLVRNTTGVAKVSIATLMLAGVWIPSLSVIPAVAMSFMMIAAQFFHFRADSPLPKRIPSFILLALCVYIYLA